MVKGNPPSPLPLPVNHCTIPVRMECIVYTRKINCKDKKYRFISNPV